jgi:hypothetical protein
MHLIRHGDYEGFISFLTLLEIDRAPEDIKGELERLIAEAGLTVLEETAESLEIADMYIREKIIPP